MVALCRSRSRRVFAPFRQCIVSPVRRRVVVFYCTAALRALVLLCNPELVPCAQSKKKNNNNKNKKKCAAATKSVHKSKIFQTSHIHIGGITFPLCSKSGAHARGTKRLTSEFTLSKCGQQKLLFLEERSSVHLGRNATPTVSLGDSLPCR